MYRLFDPGSTFYGVDATGADAFLQVIAEFRPEAVVNAIGIVKQRSEAKEVIPSLVINSLLPHQLAIMCRDIGARLIHFSTDCIFSGRKGNYCETDFPDADDLYGRTKLLGEVSEPHCITLRTSMIGPELSRKTGLLEWFLSQRGKTVKGFTKAIFSGFPTSELAHIVELVLTKAPAIHGVYHVAADPTIASGEREKVDLDLVAAVRASVSIPLAVKLSPYYTALANFAALAEGAGADGLVLFNR